MGDLRATEIRITGTVHGAGFRLMVWRLAYEEGLVGEVLKARCLAALRDLGQGDVGPKPGA